MSTGPVPPFIQSQPQSNLLDLGRAAGFGFVVAMCPLGPTAAPGAEFQHGTHAQAIHAQATLGTQTFKSAKTVSAYRAFEFTSTPPQYVDPPQPLLSRAAVKVGEVVLLPAVQLSARPQDHDPTPYLQPNVVGPTVTESIGIGWEYQFGTHQKAYYDSQGGSVVWPSLRAPIAPAQIAPLQTITVLPQELGRDLTQQAWFTQIPLNQGWILTYAGAGPQAFDFTLQCAFSSGVVNYGPGQAKSSPVGFFASPQADTTQIPAQTFHPPLKTPVFTPPRQVAAGPDRADYSQPAAVITRSAVAGSSKFPMRPTISVPQQSYVDLFPVPFSGPVIGVYIPPTPPVIPNNCTNLWDFSGNWNWDFSGYPGWSWDGYEPTPLECAVTYFAEVGVNVGLLTYQCSNTGVPAGWVITGYVPFINPALAGQYIPLTLSSGPCPVPQYVTVPNVVGLFYYDAQLAILDAGLRIAQPAWALSSTVLPQYVISQSVPAGSSVLAQTQVSIVVSGFTVLQQPGIPTPVP